jgi:hypothetical protein
VQVYNCNTNTDATGDHPPVTLYLRDVTAGSPYTNEGTIDAQYNSAGSCPYNEDGTPASPEATIDLTPYTGHTVQIVAVDPGLIGCGSNDPTIAACILQGYSFPASSKGTTTSVQFT